MNQWGYNEDQNSKGMVPPPQPWKGMVKIKKYQHHTLYEYRTGSGKAWRECFLNWEIAKAEGKIDVQVVQQGRRYMSNGKNKR